MKHKTPRAEPADGDMAYCDNCRDAIEYDSGNQPPWTHVATGFSNCGEGYEDFHAEPER